MDTSTPSLDTAHMVIEEMTPFNQETGDAMPSVPVGQIIFALVGSAETPEEYHDEMIELAWRETPSHPWQTADFWRWQFRDRTVPLRK